MALLYAVADRNFCTSVLRQFRRDYGSRLELIGRDDLRVLGEPHEGAAVFSTLAAAAREAAATEEVYGVHVDPLRDTYRVDGEPFMRLRRSAPVVSVLSPRSRMRIRDGDGNLIAPDGRLYPLVAIWFGRDVCRGPGCWRFQILWHLTDHPGLGESVYEHSWALDISIHRH